LPDPFWTSLVIKMLTAAGIVVLTGYVVERLGPFAGALIATLPVSAGPAYVFLAMDHDAAFIARSALTSLTAAASTAIFIIIYAHLAQCWPTLVCIAAAAAAWVASTLASDALGWSWPPALAGVLLVHVVGIGLTWHLRAPSAVKPFVRRWYDPFMRAAAVMVLVAGVVLLGRLLGPTAAGMAAVVPLVFTSLGLILQPRVGGPATAAVMVNGLPFMMGFCLALASVHLAAIPLGVWIALGLGLAICVGWNVALLAVRLLGQRLRAGEQAVSGPQG
jgi:hypothetical protein